jgi:thiamine kinase-like enzyme
MTSRTPADPAVPLLDSHDQLTNEWLSDALRHRTDGAVVASFERRPMGEGVGMMATLELVDVEYERERPPDTVVVKLKAVSDTNRAVALAFDTYRREALFYKQIAERTSIGTPRVLMADVDGSEDFVLVLEDLSGYRLGDQVTGCNRADAETAVVGLARLHAPFWNDVDHDDFEFIPYETPSTHGDALREGSIVGWDGTLAAFGEQVPESLRAVKDRFLAAVPALQRWLVTAPTTIVHGDFRMDNLFFGRTDDHLPIVVIDWQGCLRSKGVRDVAYLLSQSMPTAERRACERDLVELWRRTLLEGGVTDYPPEQAWEDYRRAVLALWTLVVVIAGTLDSSNERGRAWMTEMIRRSAATIEDHDLLELLIEFE